MTPVKHLFLLSCALCLYCLPLQAQGQVLVCNCPADTLLAPDTTLNRPDLYHAAAWSLPGLNYNDRAEAPAVLRIENPDSCGFVVQTLRYELELDLDDNGIPESQVRSDQAPPPGQLFFNNLTGTGVLRTFDQRPLPDSLKYRFGIQTDSSGFQVVWTSANNPGLAPELPHGLHRIRWILTDTSGLEKTCSYWFRVRDTAPPVIQCNLSLGPVFTMPSTQITLWASDLMANVYDNCYPQAYLTLGLREAGTGTGFPLNLNGTPQVAVQFDCMDLGPHDMEVWCRDLAGNASYCTLPLFLKANLLNCEYDPYLQYIGGKITKPDGAPVKDVHIHFAQYTDIFSPIIYNRYTDTSGTFLFLAPVMVQAPLVVEKNNHFLNGVSTFDLVQMSRHILGIAPFTTPYQLIAADVNRSGSVTNFDIIETRKLILGIYDTFPNNTSWRFLHKTQTFSNPANPFLDSLIESTIIYPNGQDRMQEDFTAIKIGDVNNSAIGSAETTDERARTPFALRLPDAELSPGETIEVRLEAATAAQGLQFTLELGNLELLEILPENGMTTEHFGIFPEAFTCAWEQENPAAFRLRLRAHAPGRLREQLRISDRITRAEAYGAQGMQRPELVFLGKNAAESAILYQNQPNPFSEQTTVPFYLPQAATVRLSVQDVLGRVVFQQQAFYEKGQQQWTLLKNNLPGAGVYTYTLETGGEKLCKLLVQW
jgi:hypothetical protein